MDNPNVTISDLFVGVRESLKKYERRQKQQQKKAQQKRQQQQQQKQKQRGLGGMFNDLPLFSSQLNNKKPDAAVMSGSSTSAAADVGGDATTSCEAATSTKTPFSIGSSSIPTPTLLSRQGSTDEPIVPQPTMSSPCRPPYSKRVSSDLTTSGTTTATRRMSSSMLWTAAFDTDASKQSTSNLLDQSSSSLFNQSSSNFSFFDSSTPAEGKEEDEVPSCSDDEDEEDNDILSSTLPPSPPLSSKSSPTEYIPLCEQRRRAEVEASIRRTLASLMPNTNSNNNIGTFGSTSNKFIKPLEWNKPSFTFGGSNSEGKKRKTSQEEDETEAPSDSATGSSSCSSNNTHYSGLDTIPPRSHNSAPSNITPCTSSTSMMLGGYSSTFNNGSMLPSTMSLSSNPYQLPSYNTYNYKRTWTKEEVDGLVEFADKWITPDMKNKKRRLG